MFWGGINCGAKPDHEKNNQHKSSWVSVSFVFNPNHMSTPRLGPEVHFYRASPAKWNKVSAVILKLIQNLVLTRNNLAVGGIGMTLDYLFTKI